MKLKEYSIEDLEQMTFSDITEIILTEKGNKMKIVDVFKKICTALNMSDAEFENKVADFFELIATDSKFIILDKGYCDLRKKHAPNVVIEEEEEEEEEEIPEEVTEDIPEEEDSSDIYYDTSSEEDDLDDGDDDELSDFMVIDEDEEAGI